MNLITNLINKIRLVILVLFCFPIHMKKEKYYVVGQKVYKYDDEEGRSLAEKAAEKTGDTIYVEYKNAIKRRLAKNRKLERELRRDVPWELYEKRLLNIQQLDC